MKVSKLQGRRFFKMFDPLIEYANEKLDVVEPQELFDGSLRGYDERAQAEIAAELWENLYVIDDFVHENPAALSAGELETVSQWRHGLSGNFLVQRYPDGMVRFSRNEIGFEVCGFSREIEDMLGSLPVMVETTLLPFDGLIVYSEYLNVMDARYSDPLLDLFSEWAEDVLAQGQIVSTAEGLLSAAKSIRDSELQRDIDDMLGDLDQLERESGVGVNASGGNAGNKPAASSQASRGLVGQTQPGAVEYLNSGVHDPGETQRSHGRHRGVLAGLPEEERQRRIDDRFNTDMASSGITPVERLKGISSTSQPQGKLVDLLQSETKDKLLEIADLFYVRGVSRLRKADLAERLAEEVPTKGNIEFLLDTLSSNALKGLRQLVRQRGVMHVQEADVRSLALLPKPMTMICYVFYDGVGLFSFVMPDEVYKIACDIDWDDIIAHAERYGMLVNLAEGAVQLRGLVPIDDFAGELKRLYPDLYGTNIEIVEDLLDSVATGYASYLLVDDGNELYLMHYELYWQREYDLGIESDGGVHNENGGVGGDGHNADSIIEYGPLGETAGSLLRMQEGKSPRPLELEMLADGDLFHWKEKQPAVLALRNFLDANVPDVRDDHYFADKVIEELLQEMIWGAQRDSIQRYLAILEENDFVPDMDEAQHVLNLLSNMANGLPVWPNNGWAPFELVEAETGRRLFLNEDGAPRKIGRNDPCPCGSGKKYKKCCGR